MTGVPTRFIEITNLGFANGNRVFAKCENENPISHSHYDRVYRRLIDFLPDKVHREKNKYHLLETSSGNAGTAFSRIASQLSFKATIVFPQSVRKNRISESVANGVDVIRSQYSGYMNGALKTFKEKHRELKKAGFAPVFLNHSQSWQSVVALKQCGDEITAQAEGIGVKMDFFLSALGNGTSTTGIGMPLKSRWNSMKIIGYEPQCAPVFHSLLNHVDNPSFQESQITGTGVWGIKFPNMILSLLDKVSLVDENSDFIPNVRRIVSHVHEQFDLSVGVSSAVGILEAKKLCEGISNQNVMVVFYDTSEFYDELS